MLLREERSVGALSTLTAFRRLEPLLPSLDSEHNVLVVSHQAVIRCLLAFLLRLPGKDVPYIKVRRLYH